MIEEKTLRELMKPGLDALNEVYALQEEEQEEMILHMMNDEEATKRLKALLNRAFVSCSKEELTSFLRERHIIMIRMLYEQVFGRYKIPLQDKH